MKLSLAFILLAILVGSSACQLSQSPTEPMVTFEFPTMPPPPTFKPWTPEPTATILIPTPTLTPLPLPPVEDFFQRYSEEVDPLVMRLTSAPTAPAGFILPPVEDEQIQFVPMDKRLYYVQSLLFPGLISGNPSASTHLYVAYSYGRSGCLGLWGMSCDVEGMDMTVWLFAETSGTTYLVEKMPDYYSGVGAPGSKQIPQHAIVPLSSLGEQATRVEEILETLVGFAVGVDPVDSAWPYISPDIQTRVAILRLALSSQYWSDRREAADSLAQLGPDAAGAVPELINLLSDEETRVHDSAISALYQIGPAASEAVPSLTGLLDDESLSFDHSSIIAAIGKIGAAETVLPTLVSALKDTDASVRKAAVKALGDFGVASAPAVADLTLLLTDEDMDVRNAAAQALGEIGPEASESVPALVAALNNTENDEYMQCRISTALGNIGPEAAAAVPSLIPVVEGGGMCDNEAIEALGNIGPAAAEAVPAIVPYLTEDFKFQTAVEALRKMGPSAIQAVPALIDALRNQDYWYAHDKMAEALTAITGQSLGEDADKWQAWWDANKP